MLCSGKFDISSIFTGKVKMPCTDEAVNDNKAAVNIWFEIFIDDGKYKKNILYDGFKGYSNHMDIRNLNR